MSLPTIVGCAIGFVPQEIASGDWVCEASGSNRIEATMRRRVSFCSGVASAEDEPESVN